MCDSSWEAVNEMEVGGRNLLLNSKLETTDRWAHGGQIVDGFDQRAKAFYYDNTNGTNAFTDKLSQLIHDGTTKILEGGVWYSLSFYAKGSGVVRTHIYPGLIDSSIKGFVNGEEKVLSPDGYNDVNLTSNWTRYTYIFKTKTTLPISDNRLLFRIIKGSKVYVCKPMIEKGNKITDWSPAPEDTDTELSNIKTNYATKADLTVKENSINASVDKKLGNYMTKTNFDIEADKIVASFTSTGGHNLIKNGKAKNGTYGWSNNGGGIVAGTSSSFGTCFDTTMPDGIRGAEIKLKNDTDYVYEAWIFSSVAIAGNSSTPLHFWCMSTSNTAGNSQLTILDYRQQIPNANTWTKCYVHFKTKTTGNVYFTPFIYTGSGSHSLSVTEISLSEGKVERAWTPHSSEIYEGSTIIDASGVTINNGAIKVKNKAGQTVLSGDSDGNLSLTGSLVVSSNKNQILRVDTADTKYPHMVIDSYGPYMDRLSVCSDYAGYAQQKAVDGVFIRNDSMTIHGTGERLFIQGDLRANGKVTSGSGFVSNKFTMGSLTDVINNAPWYGIGTSDIVWNGGNAVQLAGYWGLRLRTANTYLNMYNSVGSRLLYNNGTGTLEMGAMNTSYMHFGTDRPAFYFHQTAETAGDFKTNDTTSVSGFLGYRGGGYYRISPSSGKGSVCFEQYYPGSSTSSGLKLHIDSWYLRPNGNDGGILGTSSVRWQQAHITNGVTTGSDSKLKENIQVIPREVTISSEENNVTALDFYNYLRGSRAYTFNYKGIERTQLGILADDIPETVFNAIGLMSKTEEEYQQELETKQRCITLLEELPSLLDNEENLDKIINEEENLTLKEVREIAESEVQEPVRLINSQSHTALLQEVLSLLISKVETLEYQSQELIKRIKELENIKYKSLGN